MTEAVDRTGELGGDRRVDVARVALEHLDRRLDLAGELLEDHVLVLHLGDEARRLEQALTVPTSTVAVGRTRAALPLDRQRLHAAGRRVVRQHVLDVVDQPIVLGVEDLMDRRQGDVLVAPAVTAGEVVVEHLVVVRPGGLAGEVRRCDAVGIGNRGDRRRRRVVVGVSRTGVGVVGDVGEERCVERDDVGRHRHRPIAR